MLSRISVVFAVGLAVLSAGCDEQRQSVVDAENVSADDDLRAEEILAAVLQQYTDATTYQDKAVLYLSYRLEGRAIQEPHPWSIAWDRNDRFSAELFNAKICCDSQQLSCYVFDIETGNVDNQHLLVPANRFGRLLDDPIASHFIFGTSELPLYDEKSQTDNPLIPPMIGFVESELMPAWLKNPDQIRRLENDDSTGTNCYVIEMVEANRNYRVWVDQESGMIEQIQLPFEYLDSQILASKEVTDLRFFVRFHDAVVNVPHEPDQFAIKDRLASKIVQRFVTLPEPLPSEIIGERVANWDLFKIDGKAYTPKSDKSTALVWVVGTDAQRIVKQLGSLDRELLADVAVVYSDDLVAANGSDDYSPVASFGDELAAAGLRGLYDPQMKASSQIKLKSVPSFVVFDKDSKLQFAKPIDEDTWQEELAVAIKRVSAGENLAAEMKREYSKFLDSYHRQIAEQGAGEGNSVIRSNPITSVASKANLQNKSVRLMDVAELSWETSELKTPGNIQLQPSQGKAFVIDGWQTVVELDETGQVLTRHRLPIPSDAAINRIRSFDAGGKTCFAGYSMLGRRVFVFDKNWKLIRQIPSEQDEFLANRISISECQFVREGSADKLWISTIENGMFKLDLATNEVERIRDYSDTISVRGFYRSGRDLFSIVEGQLEQNSKAVDELAAWKINAVRGLFAHAGCVATGKNSAGSWNIFFVGSNGRTIWKEAIAAQYLENDVEPLVAGESLGVALCDGGKLVLFDSKGILQTILTDREVSGIAMDHVSGRLMLSEKGRVSAWNMPLKNRKFIPASTRLK